jgi:Ca2+/H+ antiporter, TMEM165/GDT1 family
VTADLLAVFGVIFMAELGDKSQLLALALSTRYRAMVVIAGIAAAAATMLGVSVIVGATLGAALPERPMQVVAGLLFVAFGVWTLRDDDDDDDDGEDADVAARGRGGFLAAYVAFLVAEFGDKTMLATAVLATTRGAIPTWIGATLGMTAASAIVVIIGSRASARLPERPVRLVVAALFVLVGLLLLVDAARG